ncbi:MAG: ABC transporter permease, partial [Hyphomicrobiales bacterium]|nr:ABC transporter permease [Hyphomicrobiales bacterium]
VMIGKTLWEEFFNNRDWPAASAVAIVLLFLLVAPIVVFQNAQAKAEEAER